MNTSPRCTGLTAGTYLIHLVSESILMSLRIFIYRPNCDYWASLYDSMRSQRARPLRSRAFLTVAEASTGKMEPLDRRSCDGNSLWAAVNIPKRYLSASAPSGP